MEKIIAINQKHLEKLIKEEMKKNGNECDLNHIDVSKIKDMSWIFYDNPFNGDISKWNVSNVKYMNEMFRFSQFKKEILGWNISNVINLNDMFKDCNTSIPWWYVDLKNKKERMEKVRRKEVMNLNKKLEQELVLNNDMKDLKEKKVFKL